jgi:rod shape-determining protein MreC
MSERVHPLRRWWPLLAAAALGLAAWGGLGSLNHVRRAVQGSAQSLAAPVALGLRSVVGADPKDDESARLRRELSLVRLENASLRDQLERLLPRDRHLDFDHQRLSQLVPCALLFRDPSTWFKGFSVDAGSAQGLSPEAGVLNADGVVGKLGGLSPESAQVLLLTDPNCRFAARLARSGLQCVVSGDGRRGCVLEHLGGEDDVRVGDQVETGPGSRSFPSGVPVGKVVRLARLEQGLRLQVEVEPSVDLERLSGLFVWVGEAAP